MTIRPAVSQDRVRIFLLLQQRDLFNPEEIQVALEVLDEALLHPEKQDYQIFCYADAVGTVSGYICFGRIPMTDGCYDLYWIVVDENQARKGIAGQLLGFMEAHVYKSHGRKIYIDTSSTPPYAPARAFYQKHGFELTCRFKDFYRSGDDKLIFIKEVFNANI